MVAHARIMVRTIWSRLKWDKHARAGTPRPMCDTFVAVHAEGILFAKNSDRDVNEAQHLSWHGRAAWPAGARVRATHIEIPQVRETHTVLLSRPFWMWGAEMGANEHGVCIGNEAVFTNQPYAATGLTGMDLLRLALERADTAKGAVEVIVSLLEAHGQGGGCGHENRGFTYHNSFLIADPRGAFVLETAGKLWAMEEVHGVRAISNGLSIPGFAEKHNDGLRSRVAACQRRSARATELLCGKPDLAVLFAALRDHGPGVDGPQYSALNGALSAPCAHAGGLIAATQTTASWAVDLRPGEAQTHWVTATAAPCLSLFKPVRVEVPLALGSAPTDIADSSLWWQHERVHRRVMANPARLRGAFIAERDALEARWLSAPPEGAEAFEAHMELLARWNGFIDRLTEVPDERPWYVRRYWRVRNRRAFGTVLPNAAGERA